MTKAGARKSHKKASDKDPILSRRGVNCHATVLVNKATVLRNTLDLFTASALLESKTTAAGCVVSLGKKKNTDACDWDVSRNVKDAGC